MPMLYVWKVGDRGCGQNIVAAWPEAVQSNKLFVCHHCHPVDVAFDSRDTLDHAISPNVLAEVSKEVEVSEVAPRYRASMAKPSITSSIYGVLSDFPQKLAPPKIT